MVDQELIGLLNFVSLQCQTPEEMRLTAQAEEQIQRADFASAETSLRALVETVRTVKVVHALCEIVRAQGRVSEAATLRREALSHLAGSQITEAAKTYRLEANSESPVPHELAWNAWSSFVEAVGLRDPIALDPAVVDHLAASLSPIGHRPMPLGWVARTFPGFQKFPADWEPTRGTLDTGAYLALGNALTLLDGGGAYYGNPDAQHSLRGMNWDPLHAFEDDTVSHSQSGHYDDAFALELCDLKLWDRVEAVRWGGRLVDAGLRRILDGDSFPRLRVLDLAANYACKVVGDHLLKSPVAPQLTAVGLPELPDGALRALLKGPLQNIRGLALSPANFSELLERPPPLTSLTVYGRWPAPLSPAQIEALSQSTLPTTLRFLRFHGGASQLAKLFKGRAWTNLEGLSLAGGKITGPTWARSWDKAVGFEKLRYLDLGAPYRVGSAATSALAEVLSGSEKLRTLQWFGHHWWANADLLQSMLDAPHASEQLRRNFAARVPTPPLLRWGGAE